MGFGNFRGEPRGIPSNHHGVGRGSILSAPTYTRIATTPSCESSTSTASTNVGSSASASVESRQSREDSSNSNGKHGSADPGGKSSTNQKEPRLPSKKGRAPKKKARKDHHNLKGDKRSARLDVMEGHSHSCGICGGKHSAADCKVEAGSGRHAREQRDRWKRVKGQRKQGAGRHLERQFSDMAARQSGTSDALKEMTRACAELQQANNDLEEQLADSDGEDEGEEIRPDTERGQLGLRPLPVPPPPTEIQRQQAIARDTTNDVTSSIGAPFADRQHRGSGPREPGYQYAEDGDERYNWQIGRHGRCNNMRCFTVVGGAPHLGDDVVPELRPLRKYVLIFEFIARLLGPCLSPHEIRTAMSLAGASLISCGIGICLFSPAPFSALYRFVTGIVIGSIRRRLVAIIILSLIVLVKRWVLTRWRVLCKFKHYVADIRHTDLDRPDLRPDALATGEVKHHDEMIMEVPRTVQPMLSVVLPVLGEFIVHQGPVLDLSPIHPSYELLSQLCTGANMDFRLSPVQATSNFEQGVRRLHGMNFNRHTHALSHMQQETVELALAVFMEGQARRRASLLPPLGPD